MDPAEWTLWLENLQLAYALTQEARCGQDVRVRVARARALIEAHYAAPLDLDRLAQQACYSPYHFLRAYRQAYGVTPHQDLTRVRLYAARRLLEETEQPITDICYAVGFQSPGSFSTLFKKHMGGSPARWRRRIFLVPALTPPPVIPFCFLSRAAAARQASSAL